MDTTVISAAMLYNLLKQQYCDAGCLPKDLTLSMYESVFQSVSRFSHVRGSYSITFHLCLIYTIIK